MRIFDILRSQEMQRKLKEIKNKINTTDIRKKESSTEISNKRKY